MRPDSVNPSEMRTFLTEMPVHNDFLAGRFTLEMGYPWITHGAILALERILKRREKGEFKILEMGSGGSTIYFSKRCKTLLSLEHNKKWYEKVKKALPKPSNVELIYNSVRKLNDVIKQQEDGYFDIVFSDFGYSYEARMTLLKTSLIKLKRFGWLVVDNYLLCDRDIDLGAFDVYTFDMFQYSGRGTRIYKKLY